MAARCADVGAALGDDVDDDEEEAPVSVCNCSDASAIPPFFVSTLSYSTITITKCPLGAFRSGMVTLPGGRVSCTSP